VTADWQTRRSELNHLRLRNLFLNALAAAVARISERNDAVHIGIADRLSRWPALAADFKTLIHDFELEMSPATALQRPPLSDFPVGWRDQAGPVIHGLWKARYPVDEWTFGAKAAVEKADATYQQIFPPGMPSQISESSLTTFHDRCLDLSEAVSRFPSRIPII